MLFFSVVTFDERIDCAVFARRPFYMLGTCRRINVHFEIPISNH